MTNPNTTAPYGLLWTEEYPGEFTETAWIKPPVEVPLGQMIATHRKIDYELNRSEEQTDSHKWWWGDQVLVGEQMLGEEFSQAFHPQAYSKGGRGNILYTCRNVGPDVRQPPAKLSFYKHTEVAPLKEYPDAQRELLEQAAEEDWHRDELRDAVAARQKLIAIEQGKTTTITDEEAADIMTPASGIGSGNTVHNPDLLDPAVAEVINLAEHRDTCPVCAGLGTLPKGKAEQAHWETLRTALEAGYIIEIVDAEGQVFKASLKGGHIACGERLA